jgi:hypothetical protein
MQGSPLRQVAVAWLAAIFVGSVATAAEPGPEKTHHFKFTIAAKMDLVIEGKTQKLVTDTEFHYSWTQRGLERFLSLDSMRVKVVMDDKPMMDTFMSRAKFVDTRDGKTTEVPLEQAPEQLKKMLLDTFGVPVCAVELDESGNPVKRTLTAGPGAKAMVDNGVVANGLLFHTPYRPGQDEWQADNEVTMGSGGFARGKLTYKKVPGDKDGQVFNVSGTLACDNFKVPGTPLTHTNARYVVSGQQRYDPAKKEWVSGQLKMDVSYQMAFDEKPVGSAKGAMTIALEEIPGSK